MTRRWLSLLLLLTVSLTGCGYNRIQSLTQQVESSSGMIQAQLQRRADLIPNLVNTVKGYATHEEATLTKIAEARAGLVSALATKDPGQMADADAKVNTALRGLFVAVEAYPNLKADQSFLRLQDELTGTENRIAVARQDYNTAVKEYNTYITQFPAVLTAKATGAGQKPYYQATSAEANTAPTVDFSKPAPGVKKP